MKYCIQYQSNLSGIIITGFTITENIESTRRIILEFPSTIPVATWKIKLKNNKNAKNLS